MSEYECIKCGKYRHVSELDDNLICEYCWDNYISNLESKFDEELRGKSE